MKLNIGCGRERKEGYINIDKSPNSLFDRRVDITTGLPYKDGEADEVYAWCVLEQIPQERFVFVMNEIWRVLRKGGVFKGGVPSPKRGVLFRDPMDLRYFTSETFEYFCEGVPRYKDYGSLYGFMPWESCTAKLNPNGIWEFELLK